MATLLSDTPEFDFGAPIKTELKGLPGIHAVIPMGQSSDVLRSA